MTPGLSGPDLLRISPLLATFLAAVLTLVLGARRRTGADPASGRIAEILFLLGCTGAMGALAAWGTGDPAPDSPLHGILAFDPLGRLLGLLVLGCTLALGAVSPAWLRRTGCQVPEYQALLLLGITGALLLLLATDLLVLFLGLEILGLSGAVLAALQRGEPKSVEAGLKYFVLGAFSSALLLYGVALVYGAVGDTTYAALRATLAGSTPVPSLASAGLALVLVGLAFKVAAVPFHFWAPDVYEGAPAPITGWMGAVGKIAAAGALLRILGEAFPPHADLWSAPFALMAALSMGVGSLGALRQQNLKRLLAFSSIAHAGFLLMALAAVPAGGPAAAPHLAGVPFHLVAYGVAVTGVFVAGQSFLVGDREALDLAHLRGLGRRQPRLAAVLALLLLSLAGLPGTAGFMGKLHLFLAALAGGRAWLVGVAALAAAVGFAAYLRPIVALYQEDGEGTVAAPAPCATTWALLGLAAVLTVALGWVPAPLIDVASRALAALAN